MILLWWICWIFNTEVGASTNKYLGFGCVDSWLIDKEHLLKLPNAHLVTTKGID